MFWVLPMAADVAASLNVSDRTEVRLRDPGDFSGPSLDLSTTPDARLALRSPQAVFTLGYEPRVTVWDINDIGVHPLLLSAGHARAEWHDVHTTLSVDESASYGATNFAALSSEPTPEGTSPTTPAPHLDVIPTPQVIQYESSSSTLQSVSRSARWELRWDVSYQLSGGADAAAQTVIPLQKGPEGEVALGYALTPTDRETTLVNASQSTFSSGPEIDLGEADEAWRHRFSPVTDAMVLGGFSYARVQAFPDVPFGTQKNPVAEAMWETVLPFEGDRLSLSIDARLGPVINRLLGIVDERVQGTVVAKWVRGPWQVTAFANAQQSTQTNSSYATTLLTGEIGAAYKVSDVLSIDGGVRGLWQNARLPSGTTVTAPVVVPGETNIVEATLGQGVLFLGATLRAPEMRL